MNRKRPALKEFQKSWWWNREDIRRNGVEGVTWPIVEIAARNYEIMRRLPEGKQYASTYLELNGEDKMIVHQLWVTWEDHPMRTAFSPKDYLETGWTPVSEGVHRQWNLRLADKTLIDAFIKEIRQIRESQKIIPKHPNKGKKNRGVSWRYVELLDCEASRDGEPLNGADRHMVSEARKMGARYAKEYREALAEWKNRPNPWAALEAAIKEEEETDMMQQLVLES
jgi:hypothetical protein